MVSAQMKDELRVARGESLNDGIMPECKVLISLRALLPRYLRKTYNYYAEESSY